MVLDTEDALRHAREELAQWVGARVACSVLQVPKGTLYSLDAQLRPEIAGGVRLYYLPHLERVARERAAARSSLTPDQVAKILGITRQAVAQLDEHLRPTFAPWGTRKRRLYDPANVAAYARRKERMRRARGDE